MRLTLITTTILVSVSCGGSKSKASDAGSDGIVDSPSDMRTVPIDDSHATTNNPPTDTGTYNVHTGPCGSTGQVCCAGYWCLGFATCVSGACEGDTGASPDTELPDTHVADTPAIDTGSYDSHVADSLPADTGFGDMYAADTVPTDTGFGDSGGQ